MNDKFRERLDWILVAAFILIVLWVTMPIAFASGDCKGQSCNQSGGDTVVNTDVSVGGTDVSVGGTDVNVGGTTIGDTNVPVNVTTGDMVDGDTSLSNNSKALALSNSLGDVDIAGCLGSTQWATPLFSKQKLVVNWPCLAEFYLRNGQYKLASMAICNTEIVKEFANEAECEAAHDFKAIIEEPVLVMAESNDDDEIEYLRDELEEQAMLHTDLEAKIKNLEQSKRIVIREPYLSESQRTALQELKQ